MTQPTPIARLVRHPFANSESLESSALIVGAVAFVITTIVALLVFWGAALPIAGPGSVAQFVAIASGVAALIVFVGVRAYLSTEAKSGRDTPQGLRVEGARLHWFDIAALALAHAIIALLGWLAMGDILERSFTDAMVYWFPASLLAGTAVALTSYVVVLSAARLTPMLLSVILAAFLVVGVFASMLSASDPHWWKLNLSTLGISDDISALAFNLTLIIAGVIVTTVAHYATSAIPVTTPSEARGRARVRVGLVAMGILLACVGIFPVDRFLTLHNISASGMAVIFVVLTLGMRRLVPRMPRVFVLMGYVFVGVIALIAVFFITGYYNLTAVELVAFLLIFSWLILFIRNTASMSGGGDRGEAAGAATLELPDTAPAA
jgi:hypothetical protein